MIHSCFLAKFGNIGLSDTTRQDKIGCFVFYWNVSNNYWMDCNAFLDRYHGIQRMNPNNFGDPLTFPLVSHAGQMQSAVCWHLDGAKYTFMVPKPWSQLTYDPLTSPPCATMNVTYLAFRATSQLLLDELPWRLNTHIHFSLRMNFLHVFRWVKLKHSGNNFHHSHQSA